MRPHAPLITAFVLVAAAGAVHGVWSGRWSSGDPLAEPVARLAGVPKTLGDWDGEDQTLGEKQQEKAGIGGYVLRRYRHRQSGEQVTLFLVCGRPGPISVHTPDVCYEGTGFARVGAVGAKAAAGAAFQAADFREQNTPVPARLRVWWSWSADGAWTTPKSPRWTFARAPALYKLYAVQRTLKPDGDADAVAGFVETLMPELRRALFETP